MKVDKIVLGATIPTQQYGNLQPSISLTDVDDAKSGLDYAMSYINNLFDRYSEKGGLVAREISTSISKKSFNEEVTIEYDDATHTYKYDNGVLKSATQLTAQFYKPFNVEQVSKACATSWEVEQDDIKKLWDSNSSLASKFGSVVHEALEHWMKFKTLGVSIAEKRGEDINYALPKHPLLRNIILDFEKLEHGHDKAELLVPEALITNVERMICGHSDLVVVTDLKKKKCRVQDYKINVGSEIEDSKSRASVPFNELPANKITKYQIQLSIYANMLELSGWEVEGLDVFVYEDEWKHHKLEVLSVIK